MFKIKMRWINYLDCTIQVSYAIGQLAGIIISMVLLVIYTIVSPVLMWLPLKEVKHPTILDDMVKCWEKHDKEAVKDG